MDNLQPGDTISNKYGKRKVLAVLPGVVLLNASNTLYMGHVVESDKDKAGKWYTISELKRSGYELTLNDEPQEN